MADQKDSISFTVSMTPSERDWLIHYLQKQTDEANAEWLREQNKQMLNQNFGCKKIDSPYGKGGFTRMTLGELQELRDNEVEEPKYIEDMYPTKMFYTDTDITGGKNNDR